MHSQPKVHRLPPPALGTVRLRASQSADGAAAASGRRLRAPGAPVAAGPLLGDRPQPAVVVERGHEHVAVVLLGGGDTAHDRRLALEPGPLPAAPVAADRTLVERPDLAVPGDPPQLDAARAALLGRR